MPSTSEILKTVADNPLLFEELRQLFNRHFELNYNELNKIPNTTLAEFVRARLDGKKLIEAAFKDIENMKSLPDKLSGTNPAR